MINAVVLIPVHNHIEYTRKCLHYLREHLPSDSAVAYSIVVIDDGSTDGTAAWIKNNFPEVDLLYGDGNLWWSGGINVGAAYAINELNADYLILWNNDIIAADDYFEKLSQILKNGREKVFGSKIYVAGEQHLVWSMGGMFNPYNGRRYMLGYFKSDIIEYQKITESDWLTGMGTVVHKSVIDKIGYWDDTNFPQYHGDSDFTYRAKINGFKIKVFPELKIWNDVKNTGLKHGDSLRNLMKIMVDTRSNYNLKKNLLFYRKYAKSIWAYNEIIRAYYKLVGGFIKWKFLGLFSIKRNTKLSQNHS
jgi:GT2 family glycosyltransferase